MTAMSSRRVVAPVVERTVLDKFLVGFVLGFAMLIAGLQIGQNAIAGIGLVVFVASVILEVIRVRNTDGNKVPNRQ